MATNKYSTLTPRQTVHATDSLLEHAKPHLTLDKIATVEKMPKNSSDTIKLRRYLPFSAVTAPLTEGVTPSSTAMTYEDFSATLRTFGEPVLITDDISDLHEDPILMKATELCGENAGRTLEQLNYGKVKAGTTVFRANGSARSDINTPITLNAQRRVIRYLTAQKAKPITKMIGPSNNYQTNAVQAAYIAITHTDVASDIENLPGFTPVVEYGSYKPISDREIGKVGNVRYICSADLGPFMGEGSTTLNGMVAADSTNVDVYPILYFGQDAYTTVALRGMESVSVKHVPVQQATKDDPLAQRGYVSWKTRWAGVITNQTWMARLEVGVSDLM